jgi:uncharacterized membrane protein/chorismate-pyruvate lyase
LTIKRFSWGVMALMSASISVYAVAVLVIPGFGPPLVNRLRDEMPAVVLAHIGASLVALATGPWQFNARLRSRALTFHRWLGRAYIVAVLLGGSAGLVLARTSQAGIVTHVGFGLLAVVWLFSTIQAYRAIRRGEELRHRAWMIRSFALTFAAVTLRNILPLELVLGVPFPVAYRIVAWAAWLPNLAVAEWLVRRRSTTSVRARLATALAVTLAVIGVTAIGAQDVPAWPDTYTRRVEVLALLQTLNARILAGPSSTTALEIWCREHHLAEDAGIVADVIRERYTAPSTEQLQRLDVAGESDVKYRRVRLRCGTRVLSQADNWYVPARLTADMNRQLDTTDAPFGRVVAPLQPYRRTFSDTMLWSPLPTAWELGGAVEPDAVGRTIDMPTALFEHRAVLYARDNRPFSEVHETYQRDILAFPPPKR